MNYSDLYNNTKRRLVDGLLSMWVSGKEEEQKYLRYILEEKEPLLAEPVFQSIFPWKASPYTFEDHAGKLNILDKNFIDALSDKSASDFRFPKDRYPYLHQTESWDQLLNKKKTIVVTSGTGSGKTECFMIPVLQDLLRQKKAGQDKGIQALFLYPLNALMDSQRTRVHAWAEALSPQVTYAIYNGNTPFGNLQGNIEKQAYPEIVSRPSIRKNPPQILFTNPTMLEYMLVRASDKPILEQSQGTLRWILLDETHTYSGSAAAELALQLRRVLDAFGVSVDKVNFAATSATIGDDESQLKNFISQLTGKNLEDIVIVSGERIIPEIDNEVACKQLVKINTVFNSNIKVDDILLLRQNLNSVSSLSLSEISTQLKIDKNLTLDLIDHLGEKTKGLTKSEAEALFPTRAHFFTRSINGLYVCPNKDCTIDEDKRLSIGSITTEAGTKCKCCESELLEVAFCGSCGEVLAAGDFDFAKKCYKIHSHQDRSSEDLFEIEQEEEDDDNDNIVKPSNLKTLLLTKNKTIPPHSKAILDKDIKFIGGNTFSIKEDKDSFVRCENKNSNLSLCPNCGSSPKHLRYPLIGAPLIGRMLSSTLLQEAEPMKDTTSETLWDGRKYIAFTDNRQGTAKSALAQNIMVERSWIRSAIYHFLSDKRRNDLKTTGRLTTKEEEQLEELYNQKEKYKGNQFVVNMIEKKIEELEQKTQSGYTPEAIPYTLNTVHAALMDMSDLSKLYTHLEDTRYNFIGKPKDQENVRNKENYLNALFVDELGKRPRRGNSLESMGLVELHYPNIGNINAPNVFKRNGFSDNDWHNYLKICVDYLIRRNMHYKIPENANTYLPQNYFSDYIYSSELPIGEKDSRGNRLKKWPSLNYMGKNVSEKQSRIILLLCAAMNIVDVTAMTQNQIDDINEILRLAWKSVSENVLDRSGESIIIDGQTVYGYKLDIFNDNKVKIRLNTKSWECPINHTALDCVFKGFSPLMTGYIDKNTYDRFKISKQAIEYPYFPFAYGEKKNETGGLTTVGNETEITDWIRSAFAKQIEQGLWSNLHENIILKKPIYITAEHSAQLNRSTLQHFEEEFRTGKVNILSCSTTMEMGVDLGGISAVVMNNVPPKPANYLQRAGRAARRGESKAVTLTICSPTPIGTNTFKNPKWAMEHTTAMPIVKMESNTLVQRHINSLLFSIFVSRKGGVSITNTLNDFFFSGDKYYTDFLDFLNSIIISTVEDDVLSSYQYLVKGTIKEFTSIADSAYQSLTHITKLYSDLLEQKLLLEQTSDELNKHGSEKQGSAVKSQVEKLMGIKLIGFLGEKSFIPSAGIPIGLVEFHINSQSVSRHLSVAIAEYAPGNHVVINENVYQSGGIELKSQWKEAKRALLQNCPNCGFSKIVIGKHLENCTYCGSGFQMQGVKNLGLNKPFSETVEPAGFEVDISYKPNRKNQHAAFDKIDPVLLEMEPWSEDAKSNIINIRQGTPQSEILYYNRGGDCGFAFCTRCGKMEKETTLHGALKDENPLLRHSHLKTGAHCSGTENQADGVRRNVLLVGRYQTDLVEIRLKNEKDENLSESTLYTLGVILSRKLAEYLGVEQQEIGFGINKSFHSIFIFDTALGGAGYSPLFAVYKNAILDMATKALNSCNCKQACTACLIDKDTQWHLDSLDKEAALDWLKYEQASRVEIPSAIIQLIPDATRVTSNIDSELINILQNTDLQEVKLFISNNIAEWQPQNWRYNEIVKRLKLQGKTVKFVLPPSKIDLSVLSASELTTLLQLNSMYSIGINTTPVNEIHPLLIAKLSDGKSSMYFSETNNRSFNENWGTDSPMYQTYQTPRLTINQWMPDLSLIKDDKNIMFDFNIMQQQTYSNSLGALLYDHQTEKWKKIANMIEKSSVDISYTDIYLRSPIGCAMLVQLLEWLKDELTLNIKSLTLNFAQYARSYSEYSGLIDQDFEYSTDRNNYIKDCVVDRLGITPRIIEQQLPHFRELSLVSDQFEFIIRPDGGIANGWIVDRAIGRIYNNDLKDDLDQPIRLYNKETHKKGILYTITYKQKR